MLDELSKRCFRYFWDASDPETGICRDLIHGNPSTMRRKGDEARGSTGVTGFCLTAMCIGAERKWIPRQQAKDRVRRALRSYTNGKVVGTMAGSITSTSSYGPAVEGCRSLDQ